jgi:hypothetical protein
MVQEILTYIILLITLSAVIWKLYRLYRALNDRKSNRRRIEKCDSCSSGCTLNGLNENPECPLEQADQKN